MLNRHLVGNTIRPRVIGQRNFWNSKFNPFKWYQDNAVTPGQIRVKKDLKRGNLWEFHQISRSDARPFEPIITLSNPKPFPKLLLKGTNLNKEEVDLSQVVAQNPATLVIVLQKRILSGFMSQSWREPFRDRYPNAPIIEVIIDSSLAYTLVNPYVNKVLRSTIPEADQKYVIRLSTPRSIDLTPESLGVNVENGFLAYPFLLNSKGQILFSAVGKAKTTDIFVLNGICDKFYTIEKK